MLYKVLMRKKLSNQVSTRLTDEELAMLKRISDKESILPATLLRKAFRVYALKNGETLTKSAAKPTSE